MRWLILAALAALTTMLLSGCAGPQDQETAALSGAFTADRTEADIDDFAATFRAHGLEPPALMESFPEQFRATLPRDDCHAVRADLVHKEYLGHLSGCALQ